MWFLVWLGILVCVVVINLVWVKIMALVIEDDGFVELLMIDSVVISILICMYLVAKGILVIG